VKPGKEFGILRDKIKGHYTEHDSLSLLGLSSEMEMKGKEE